MVLKVAHHQPPVLHFKNTEATHKYLGRFSSSVKALQPTTVFFHGVKVFCYNR